MQISSVCRSGILFAFKNPVVKHLSHTRLYLHSFRLDCIKSAMNIPSAKRAIHPFGFIILSYCFHSLSSGKHISFLFCVLPYGRSQRIISTDEQSMLGKMSKQSALISESPFPKTPQCVVHSNTFLSTVSTNKLILLRYVLENKLIALPIQRNPFRFAVPVLRNDKLCFRLKSFFVVNPRTVGE